MNLGQYIDDLAGKLGRTVSNHYLWSQCTKLSADNIPYLMLEMNRRSASNDLDKIAGLLFMFLLSIDEGNNCDADRTIPVYLPTEAPSEAWRRMIRTTACFDAYAPTYYAITMMEVFPHPSSRNWYPSWEQVTKYPDLSVTEPQDSDDTYYHTHQLYTGHLVRDCVLS